MKLWLLASVVGIVWNLLPVFAQYRLDQQKLAELEEQRRHPPLATVDIAEDSPWPGSTILMQGQPVEGFDDSQLPGGNIQYGQLGGMAVTHGNVSLIKPAKAAAKLIRSFPDRRDTEHLFAAAISGDGKVVATVGVFTQVSFWNAETGQLLHTVEDEFPTAAAEPDTNQRKHQHANGLRYSHAGVRKIVAAPGGCLSLARWMGRWSCGRQKAKFCQKAPILPVHPVLLRSVFTVFAECNGMPGKCER